MRLWARRWSILGDQRSVMCSFEKSYMPRWYLAVPRLGAYSTLYAMNSQRVPIEGSQNSHLWSYANAKSQ